MKIAIPLLFFASIFNCSFGQEENGPEVNVVYGDKHIFTIENPGGWINDKTLAQEIGLVCFFYPKDEKEIGNKNYFYANGIDKESSTESLEEFIEGDLEVFGKKYPDVTYEEIPIDFTGGLRNGVLLSFSNLTDRFKEEVIYVESDDSILIFSFAAMTEEAYQKYQPIFDGFISSFNYRGNNPKPFLDYMNNKNKAQHLAE